MTGKYFIFIYKKNKNSETDLFDYQPSCIKFFDLFITLPSKNQTNFLKMESSLQVVLF